MSSWPLRLEQGKGLGTAFLAEVSRLIPRGRGWAFIGVIQMSFCTCLSLQQLCADARVLQESCCRGSWASVCNTNSVVS